MFNENELSELVIKAIGNMSISKFSEISNVSRTYLSDAINKKLKNPMSADILKRIANASNDRIYYIDLMKASGYIESLEYKSDEPLPDNVCESIIEYNINNLKKIPVLGYVAAGNPIIADEHIIEYDYVKTNYPIKELFYLKVSGDSMRDKHIIDGSLVLVHKQNCIENNDIAVVLINGCEATVKEVRFMDGKIYLIPANPDYDIKIYNYDEVEIIGKVIEYKYKI